MLFDRIEVTVRARSLATLALLLLASLCLPAAEIDWRKVARLQDQEFLAYFETLGLEGQEAIDFWKKIPLSPANSQVSGIYRREAFAIYMHKYPRPQDGARGRGAAFEVGMGTDVIGPISGQRLRLPFSGYEPLPEGPVGDPERTYRIGYTIHGLDHPWLLNNADSAQWQADRHPNLELLIQDPGFDNEKQVAQIDAWIGERLDGILVWPMQEAPTGPPIARATEAGIPSVSVDRMVGTPKVSAQVTGNFPANGAQQGAYLVHRLMQESGRVKANILMIRKPPGSTADAMRTGHFLKVISYFPGLKILDSAHNSSNRQDSRRQVRAALREHPDLDVIFCTGAEQAMGAVEAVDEADRWDSRHGGKRILILSNDGLYEALMAMEQDKIAVTAPYTPLVGGLGLRVLLKLVGGEKVPKNISIPDLPMITRRSETVLGIRTMSVEDWIPYSYGKK